MTDETVVDVLEIAEKVLVEVSERVKVIKKFNRGGGAGGGRDGYQGNTILPRVKSIVVSLFGLRCSRDLCHTYIPYTSVWRITSKDIMLRWDFFLIFLDTTKDRLDIKQLNTVSLVLLKNRPMNSMQFSSANTN